MNDPTSIFNPNTFWGELSPCLSSSFLMKLKPNENGQSTRSKTFFFWRRIFSVNETKSVVSYLILHIFSVNVTISCEFDRIYWRNIRWKTFVLVQWMIQTFWLFSSTLWFHVLWNFVGHLQWRIQNLVKHLRCSTLWKEFIAKIR